MVEAFENALILTGPTGSGKSDLGVELAERLGAEVVSMDSMTFYRGMDIGTAKPGPELRRRVPHHLFDVLDPGEASSVAWWLDRAAACCREIESRGKRALLVGGTPLYLKAVLFGLFDGPAANPVVRAMLEREAQYLGSKALHERLAMVDSATARRLHPNDLRRIIRALEVWEVTGQPLSSRQTQWVDAPPPTKPDQILCLDLPREHLYERINERVRRMFAEGLVDEVRALRKHPLGREATQAVGYQEVLAFLDGTIQLDEAIVRVQTRTRHLAKRQLTWFRHLPAVQSVSRELTFSLWGLTMEKESAKVC